MYSRNRQKQRTDSMQVTTGERGSDAEDDDDEEEEGRRIPVRVEHASSNGTRPGTSHITISNLVNPAGESIGGSFVRSRRTQLCSFLFALSNRSTTVFSR